MSYAYLSAAILLEVVGTLLLPTSQSFTKLLPSVAISICYVASVYFLTLAIKTIPIAIVYATWSGVGIFAIAILSYFLYAQSLPWQAVLGLMLIALGVILVNSYAKLQ